MCPAVCDVSACPNKFQDGLFVVKFHLNLNYLPAVSVKPPTVDDF
jgi:hypothetical protein